MMVSAENRHYYVIPSYISLEYKIFFNYYYSLELGELKNYIRNTCLYLMKLMGAARGRYRIWVTFKRRCKQVRRQKIGYSQKTGIGQDAV